MRDIFKRWKHLGGLLAVTALLAAPAWAQTVDASFSPSRIYQDQIANYNLRIQARNISINGAIPIPEVDGLIIERQMMPNMRMPFGGFGAFTLSCPVQAERAGTFTIPSYKLGDVTVPPATLEVLPISPERKRQLAEAEAERQRQQAEAERQRQEALERAFQVNLSITDRSVYVGQAIPFELDVLVNARVYAQLAGKPRADATEFSFSSFDDPARDVTTRDSQIYQRLFWDGILTPLKAGAFPLQFVQAFEVRTGFMSSETIERQSKEVTLTVLPLPTEGRPADFTGAIGEFNLERPVLDATRVQAGEPLTMTVVVDGTGNFDRMGAPVLRKTEGWRVYPPEETFRADSAYGNEGVKTYEYLLIARDETVTQTPEVVFNFFNPETAQYVEYPMEPQTVEVLPAPPGSRPAFTPRRDASQPRGPSLLPNMTELGATTASLRPMFFNPLFLAGQSVPLAAILGLFFWRRQRLRLDTDSDYARRVRARREVARRLQAAEKAAGVGDASAFFEEAMRAIQEAVAPRLAREPESLTLHEVEAYLAGAGAGEDSIQAVRTCYEAGDALRFGGLGASNLDLRGELARVKHLIATVEGGRK